MRDIPEHAKLMSFENAMSLLLNFSIKNDFHLCISFSVEHLMRENFLKSNYYTTLVMTSKFIVY